MRNNDLLTHYLSEDLLDSEKHQLLCKTDLNYKISFNTNQLLEKFKYWEFKEKKSLNGRSEIYYKFIGKNKYLVFHQYNPNSKSRSTFDVFMATYMDEDLIGTIEPQDFNRVKLNFQLSNDFELIRKFVE